MTIELSQLLEQARLPASIDVINNLQDITAKGVASARDFAKEIQTDTGLMARIMQLANSALYGRGNIDNIEQAVMLIGEEDLVALVTSTEVIDTLTAADNRLDMRQFWRENIFSAVSARIIARRVGCPKSRLFTATLLRRIGWLALRRAYPDMSTYIQTQQAMHSDKKPHVIELSTLGFHHAALSAALLQYWKVPDSVYEPIRHYLEPKMAGAEFQRDAAIIHLAHQHTQRHFGLDRADWVDELWINDVLGVPRIALMAEADMEVHAHYNRMYSMLLRQAA